MRITAEQMLAENVAYRATPEDLEYEAGFFIDLPYGRVEVEQLASGNAILAWIWVPKSIEGHNVGSRLVTEASLECLDRGVRLLVASAMNPAALQINAKVFGADNLAFYENIPGGDDVSVNVLGLTPIPLTFEQAMQTSRQLTDKEQALIAAGKQAEADAMGNFVRSAVDLADQNVIDAIQMATSLYVPAV